MSPASLWRPMATSKEEFIGNAGRLDYLRGLAANPPGVPNPNLLGFGNEGGLLNNGVCWWHSRFTRAVLYLAYFLPEAPRPGRQEALEIVSSLMSARRVVAIPGYANLREFSTDHRASILKQFEKQQLLEGLFRFAWVNGLSGASDVSPRKMKALMDRVCTETSNTGFAYVKLQVPGMDAHSWIVTQMEPMGGDGYLYRFLDSNNPGETTWQYRCGDTRILVGTTGSLGVPYLQRSGELQRMKRLIDIYITRG